MSNDILTLTPAEQRLFNCARDGVEWEAEGDALQVLRADVIANLIAAPEHSPYQLYRDAIVHPEGLFIKNAIVVGEYLNLDGVRLRTKLFFERSIFTRKENSRSPDGGVCLRDAVATTISFIDCRFYKLDARRAKISGNVYLTDCDIVRGLNLHNCEIGGYMAVRGCDIFSEEYDPASVDPSLAFDQNQDHELRIADDICAIDGEAMTVRDSLVLSKSASGRQLRAFGQVSLERAQIGGLLDCRGATMIAPVNPPEIDDDQRIALHAAAVRVGGSVLLAEGFSSEGEVRFEHCEVTGDFWCAGGSFRNPIERIRDAKQLTRNRGLGFHGGARAQDLPASLNLRSAAVEEGIYLEDPEITAATHIEDRLILTNARCQVFCDSKGPNGDIAQPKDANRMELDGFIYRRLGECTTDPVKRERWLRNQILDHTIHHFRPQPWKRLTAVLLEMGYNRSARIIAMKRHVALRRSRSLSPLGKLMNVFLGITIGHGYRPNLALVWALLFVLPGVFVFKAAAEEGWMAPQSQQVLASNEYWDRSDCRVPASYRRLNSISYTLDMFVPIIDTLYNGDWAPAPFARACAKQEPDNPNVLQRNISAVVDAAYENGLRDLFERGFLELARWLLVVSGWILVPLFLAGVTGVVKRFED